MNRLVEHFGSRAALARALGVTRSAIYQWSEIPEPRAYQIEVLTKGKIKARWILDSQSAPSREGAA